MARWEAKRIGEVCTIKPPKAEARTKLADGDEVSFAPMEDLGIGEKYLQQRRTRQLGEVSGSYTYFADGDVLLAKITPCFENGKLGVARGLTNGVGFGSSEYIVLRPASALDAEFLYYYLARPTFLEEGARTMTGAVGHKRVTKEFVESYPIPLPPLADQRRIVAILDEAFEGIATAKTNAEKNLQNARELFDGYLETVFADAGEGWSVSRVGAVADCCLGKMLDKAKNKGDPKPYLRNLNVRWFEFDLTDVQEMRFTSDEHERYSVRWGDVVICEGGYPGRAAIWEGDEPIFIQKALHRVRFTEAIFGRWFLYYLYSQEVSGALRQYFTGTGIQHFTGAALSRFKLPLAPRAVAVALVERFDSLAGEVTRLEAIYRGKLFALDELKKSLLQQAFTGAL